MRHVRSAVVLLLAAAAVATPARAEGPDPRDIAARAVCAGTSLTGGAQVAPVTVGGDFSVGGAAVSHRGDVHAGGRAIWDCGGPIDENDLLATPGGIAIWDFDSAPSFTLTGSLDSGDWSCELDPAQAPRVSVLCTSLLIDGPDCEHLSASATALPPMPGAATSGGVARASAACVGDILSERLDTAVARWPLAPQRVADGAGVARNVSVVMCTADDGFDDRPWPAYVVACGFEM